MSDQIRSSLLRNMLPLLADLLEEFHPNASKEYTVTLRAELHGVTSDGSKEVYSNTRVVPTEDGGLVLDWDIETEVSKGLDKYVKWS